MLEVVSVMVLVTMLLLCVVMVFVMGVAVIVTCGGGVDGCDGECVSVMELMLSVSVLWV